MVVPGDHGKPRPAVIIQSESAEALETVIVCLITGEVGSTMPFRVELEAGERTGLRKPSQIMADKMFTLYREKCGPVFGHIGESKLAELNTAIAIITGLAD